MGMQEKEEGDKTMPEITIDELMEKIGALIPIECPLCEGIRHDKYNPLLSESCPICNNYGKLYKSPIDGKIFVKCEKQKRGREK